MHKSYGVLIPANNTNNYYLLKQRAQQNSIIFFKIRLFDMFFNFLMFQQIHQKVNGKDFDNRENHLVGIAKHL